MARPRGFRCLNAGHRKKRANGWPLSDERPTAFSVPNRGSGRAKFTVQEEKVSLEEQKAQKEDQFLRGRQIAFMIYDYFRVTGAHDTVFDYDDLLSVTLHDDNIQEFDTRWDEILLSMSKIPSDDILETLYKLRIRESGQLSKLYWNCPTWSFIRRYRCPIIKKSIPW